jgi:hypothetical protein
MTARPHDTLFNPADDAATAAAALLCALLPTEASETIARYPRSTHRHHRRTRPGLEQRALHPPEKVDHHHDVSVDHFRSPRSHSYEHWPD